MMLPKTWGGAGTQAASLLALLYTLWLSFSGIGCQPPAAPALPRRTVRMQALLPLHPAWAQMVALDRDLAQIHNGVAPGDTAPFQVAPPALFALDTAPPPALAQQREALVEADMQAYLDQLGVALKSREEGALARIVEPPKPAGPSAETLRHQAEVENIAQELRDKAALQAAPLKSELVTLNFRAVVLQSQIDAATTLFPNVLRNQPLFDAQLQMAEVNRQIDVKTTQIDGLEKADFLGEAEYYLRDEKGFVPVPEETPQQRLARRRAEQRALLDREREQALAKAKAELKAQPAPLPELTGGPAQPQNPRAVSLSPFVAPDMPAAFAKAQAQVDAARAREHTLHEAEKARLLAQIRADTEKAILQIARQQGWVFVPEGQSREDWTEPVAQALRAQWTPGANR